MSVYIKGFPLPNNCGACPLRLAWCRERIYMVTRPERCPLIPVPNHGRLVDGDKIVEGCKDKEGRYVSQFAAAVGETVESAPTIIPADKEETE